MDTAKSEGDDLSIKMLQRDLTQIVQMVARRDDHAGNINASLAKQVSGCDQVDGPS